MPAETAESAAQNFGLTPAQQHKAVEGPSSIQARITNLADRGGTPYVQLDNEQLWMVTDWERKRGSISAIRSRSNTPRWAHFFCLPNPSAHSTPAA